MFYIIVGCITFIAFILLIIVIYYNKFQFSIIKIDEAENNSDIFLNKKYELIKRVAPIIRKELKKKTLLSEIDDSIESLNHFELNDKLSKIDNDLFKILDENEKLLKSNKIIGIMDEFNDNEDDLVASIRFYNDTVVDFNRLIVSFPSNIIRIIFRYKRKEFYSHEKRQMYEILKEEEKDK